MTYKERMSKSGVPWADYRWNPFEGCSPASTGCEHCYAKAMAHRFHRHWGSPKLRPWLLEQPERTKKPGRVFVCSTSDLFHHAIDKAERAHVANAMAAAPWHTYIICTKRPENIPQCFGPPDNVWLGVTAENQQMADIRIPILLSIRAKVHFVSVEPMLEFVDIEEYLVSEHDKMGLNDQFIEPPGGLSTDKINWVIAGPENGRKKRPFDPEWIDALWDSGRGGIRAQCEEWSTPFFDKREGGRREWPT